MLRSVFSLIQNIIDTEKEYSNKKSSTVIYLVSNPNDNKIDMELEIREENDKCVRSIEAADTAEHLKYFSITTEQGDAITCKHSTENNIKSKEKCSKDISVQKYNEGVVEKDVGDKPSLSYENKEIEIEDKEKGQSELQGVEGISAKELLAKLSQRKETPKKDKDQLHVLFEQIQKMKKGMERLHQIAQQFTCTDKFKQDVNILMNAVKKSDDPKETSKIEASKS